MSGEAIGSDARGLAESYSYVAAWAHDHLIAEPGLNLSAYFIEQGRLEDTLAEPRERRVLDVGCGGGQNAIRFKERHPHLSLVGIDLEVGQIARARQRARRRRCAVDFEVADAQALPFPDTSFDVVVSFGSAKHWPDPLKGIGECWRVLKPGGELLIADATSDATRDEVVNFYRLMRFPRMLEKPLTGLMYRRLFRPAGGMETYRRIAARLGMPEGTVSRLPSIPIFFIRTRKPLLRQVAPAPS